MGIKINFFTDENKNQVPYFICPGCHDTHFMPVRPNTNNKGAGWEFNGDKERPTFSPSILKRLVWTDPVKEEEICHSFVTDGKIQFLEDCTHSLAGKTVELNDI